MFKVNDRLNTECQSITHDVLDKLETADRLVSALNELPVSMYLQLPFAVRSAFEALQILTKENGYDV